MLSSYLLSKIIIPVLNRTQILQKVRHIQKVSKPTDTHYYIFIPKKHSSSFSQSCPTLCDPMDCSTPGFLVYTNSWSLLRLMSIEPVMPSNHLILCHPLLLLLSIFPSIRVFSNKSTLCLRWPKYWSFSFSSSNESSGLTSFRINWFDLLAVQGTLKSLLQHYHGQVNLTLRSPSGSGGVTLRLSWKKWSR